MIMCIWLLISLTFLAVSIGRLAFSQINFSRFYLGRQFSYYLAKAAVREACLERDNDMTPNYDTLSELRTPRKIDFEDYEGEYFLIDEESKININTAEKETLTRLFDSESLAQNIIDYRKEKEKQLFSSIVELLDVEGMDWMGEDFFEEIKNLITVDSNSYVNINTVPKEALLALGCSEVAAEEILCFRNNNIFDSRTTISSVFNDLGIECEESNLLRPNSSNYTIRTSAYIGKRVAGNLDAAIVKETGGFYVKSWKRTSPKQYCQYLRNLDEEYGFSFGEESQVCSLCDID
ncbi:MAG: helix-hairpin-helix domain-containing protein [Candidatus Omnitrophica bacterium]|nr:helix-hairpin-helix domain-containing protein [Candidatus Omnitrophota bacterium]